MKIQPFFGILSALFLGVFFTSCASKYNVLSAPSLLPAATAVPQGTPTVAATPTGK